MINNDPISKEIEKKQEKMKQEMRLIDKKKPINLLILGISLLLLSGITIGIFRIFINIMQ